MSCPDARLEYGLHLLQTQAFAQFLTLSVGQLNDSNGSRFRSLSRLSKRVVLGRQDLRLFGASLGGRYVIVIRIHFLSGAGCRGERESHSQTNQNHLRFN